VREVEAAAEGKCGQASSPEPGHPRYVSERAKYGKPYRRVAPPGYRSWAGVAVSPIVGGWGTQSHGSTADVLRPPGWRRELIVESSARHFLAGGGGLTILGVSGPDTGKAGPWAGALGPLG
jgi:hypothetical protein